MSNVEMIKDAFSFLSQNQAQLTESQISFITGLRKFFKKHKTLTERQAAALFEIIKYLNIDTSSSRMDLRKDKYQSIMS